MRPYEVMVIFDVGAEPPAIQAVVERVLQTVQDRGGTTGAVDRWGRRPFAYEVRHRREGYYVVIEFSSDQATVDELDRLLSLADEAMRHKVVRIPDKVAHGRARGGAQAAGGAREPGSRGGSQMAASAAEGGQAHGDR